MKITPVNPCRVSGVRFYSAWAGDIYTCIRHQGLFNSIENYAGCNLYAFHWQIVPFSLTYLHISVKIYNEDKSAIEVSFFEQWTFKDFWYGIFFFKMLGPVSVASRLNWTYKINHPC